MDLIIALVFLIIGLGGLSFGAEFLIRGAVSISHLIGLSPFIIGLTVVAWGTSAPEVVVTVGAAVNGVPDVAVGNVIGSNITNVLLIGGAAALLLPLCCARATISRSGLFLILATLFVLFLSFGLEVLPRWAGLLMLGAMLVQTIAIFILYVDQVQNIAGLELDIREVVEVALLAVVSDAIEAGIVPRFGKP